MKKLLLLTIAGLVLAGCYHVPKPVSQETKPEPGTAAETQPPQAVEDKNTVVYGDGGFAPKAVTVVVGATVTWKNAASKTMWVASAAHPTHQELPGFDQLQSAGKDGSYNYTFTKAGTWKYHNHTAPGDTGVIVVEE